MNLKPVLTNFLMIKPPFEKTQAELNEWLSICHAKAEQSNSNEDLSKSFFNRYAVKASQIANRSFECPDITDMQPWDSKRIYRLTAKTPQGVGMLERNIFFAERAQDIMQKLYENCQNKPQHLIHVTCTGYVSPSAAQLLVS